MHYHDGSFFLSFFFLSKVVLGWHTSSSSLSMVQPSKPATFGEPSSGQTVESSKGPELVSTLLFSSLMTAELKKWKQSLRISTNEGTINKISVSETDPAVNSGAESIPIQLNLVKFPIFYNCQRFRHCCNSRKKLYSILQKKYKKYEWTFSTNILVTDSSLNVFSSIHHSFYANDSAHHPHQGRCIHVYANMHACACVHARTLARTYMHIAPYPFSYAHSSTGLLVCE